MTTTQACVDHLQQRADVEGISLCGSHQAGTKDRYSDRDLWVFLNSGTPLSDELAHTALLPPDARTEVLFEGRDDTLTPHTVVNVLTDGAEILNLKFLHTSLLAGFCDQEPQVEPHYMETLETYVYMQIQHDPQEILAGHQQALKDRTVATMDRWLLPVLVQRYSSTYWRSVFQGLLRTEEQVWRGQVRYLVEMLLWTAHATSGQVPAPRKWLLSPRLLKDLPHGMACHELLDQLQRVRCEDKKSVLDLYRSLAVCEDAVLEGLPELHLGMWWRGVFTARIPTIAAQTAEPGLLELADGAPRPWGNR
jgi:hypothetical protein